MGEKLTADAAIDSTIDALWTDGETMAEKFIILRSLWDRGFRAGRDAAAAALPVGLGYGGLRDLILKLEPPK